MLTEEDVFSLIEANLEKIRSFGVSLLELFGSYTTHSQTEKSDIDFIVQFRSGEKTFNNYMDLKFFLEELLNKNVDLVIKETLRSDLLPYINRRVIYAERI